MADENTVIAPESSDTTAEVSDQQVQDFFDKGGEEAAIAVNKEAPTDDKPDEKPAEKYVPLSALHEERERRKELKKQVEQMNQRFQQMVDSLKPAAPEPEIPALEHDPVGHFKAQQDRMERELATIKGATAEQRQQTEQQQRWNTFVGAYKSAAAEFQSSNTDFPAAYQHHMDMRAREFMAAGFNAQQAANMAQQEETAIVQKAFEDGENPAARIYALAKTRGYKAASQAVSGEQQIAAIEKGSQAKSLGSGGRPAESTSLEALASMNDEDFAKNWDKIVKRR